MSDLKLLVTLELAAMERAALKAIAAKMAAQQSGEAFK